MQALWVALLIAIAAPCLSAQSAKNDQRESPEVRKLVLRGVKHVSRLDLERSVSTQSSQCKSILLQPFCWISNSPTFVEKHYLDRDEVRRDVLRIRVYYWKRGYRETEVDTAITANGDGVSVTFDVHENAPTVIAALRIDQDSTVIPEKRRNKLTTMKVGRPLDLLALDSMRLGLLTEMWNLGFGDAVVDTAISVNPETRRAAIALRLVPRWRTVVGTIRVRGQQKVSEQTILNTLAFRPGGIFRRTDVLESQRSLYESSLFRLASILPPRGDSVKAIEIQVVEAPLHEARAGGGFNSVEFLQLEGRYTAYNLLGGARRLDVTTSMGNLLARPLNGRGFFQDAISDVPNNPNSFLQPTWSASIDFRQPSFMRRPENQAGFGVFAHRRSEPGIYIDRGYGATATFTRQVRARAPASLNYRFEVARVEASDVYFCVNYGVCDTTTIGTLRAHQRMSPIALTGFVDRSDQAFNPTRGYLARVEMEHASSVTVSDYRYNRAYLDLATYWHKSLTRPVLATHLRLGLVRPMAKGNVGVGVLHPRKRFYSGGSMSVRGYGENQLGPRVLTVDPNALRGRVIGEHDTTYTRCPLTVVITACDPNATGLKDREFNPQPLGGTSLVEGSVEYRFPLMRKLDGAVFVDGALVGDAPLQKLTDIQRITKGTGAITPGFGIRYVSPVGPIRVDIGIDPKLSENTAVVTEELINGQRKIVALQTPRAYGGETKTILSRLVLHFSIGQAF
jgi:outer membrane protein insertion porin family/translocation and assembly module TamA